ncbi:hypothetical protein OG864_29825 [Streptomyces sp. NBC_00124]|uniref:hypothetical protein n=1 Tax=Streptomyces sp. NBC_00124 TaxID=2975662 RepID=UPI002251A3AD|nr:hypothetical protein [Streptomyces sp. NBC_00124]MCX5362901.1 hypothetical protein [Streptomyces sp. NBC_00124]
MSTRPALDAVADALAAAGTCGYALVTGKPCPTHGKPTEAVATVTVRAAEDDPERITVEASSHGISRTVVAYALRSAADAFDEAARAEGDEPIPYTLTEQAEAVEEPRTPTVGDRYVKRANPDAGRIVTVNRVWEAEDGHTAVAYEWDDPRASYSGSACPLDVFHRTYETQR